jgi:transposase
MIPSGVEIFVGLSLIDLRWGFDRLAGLIADQGFGPRAAARCSCSSASARAR